jgi:phosphomannomutase/phosphoglucomutase
MVVKQRLFGTNGVRGVVNRDMTIDLACRLGYAMGTYLGPGKKVAIGTDTRTSGEMLKGAASAGVLSTGVNMVDLGVLPTPALQYAVRGKFDFGIVITASHNPPQYNGIKCIASDGTELQREEEEKIEGLYFKGKFNEARWDSVGTYSHDCSANRKYIDGVISKVDVDAIRKRAPTVVIDCGNGAASVVAPYLLESLGCKVIALNANPQGTFPGRESEPSESNLGMLIAMMRTGQADLGIAYDGDADRAVFVDEKGRYHMGDRTLALVARFVTKKKKGIVVTPVSSTMALEDVVVENGSKVVYTPVGAPIVARIMIKLKSIFGGEENGGLLFPEHQICRDGAMASAYMLEILAKEGSISKLIDTLPRYYNYKIKFECSDKLKEKVMEEILSKAEGKGCIDDMDGLKLWTDDGWVLVRPSGTEAIFRVFAEGKSLRSARALAEEWERIGRQIVKKSK